MQLNPVRTIRLDLFRPMRSVAARPNGRAYATWLLVFSLIVTMLAGTLAGVERFRAMVDFMALQSTSWSWSDPLSYGRLLSYVLPHSGANHFFWNSLLLLLIGTVVEWRLGLKVTAALFVTGAVVAAVTHLLMFPGEARTVIGASGAISTLLGAAVIVAGDLGLHVRMPGPDRWFALTLRRLGLFWLALQCLSFVLLHSGGYGQVSVAYWMHIAGFATGVSGAFACRWLGVQAPATHLEAEMPAAFAGAGD